MKLAFFGTGEFAVPALVNLKKAGYDVVSVISQPDRPAGRGRKIIPTAVHSASESLALPHAQVEDVNCALPQSLLCGADLGVVVAFGQKIGPELLTAAPRGLINIHGSLLPKYRGAAPYQWAIIRGERVSGVTIFQLNEKWDAGPIWSRAETPIDEHETADELHDRLARIGADLLIDTLARCRRGELSPLPQDVTQASRAPKLTRADSRIDWSAPARQVVRRIHGLWSWPTATCLLESRRERVQLARAHVEEEQTPPTEICPVGTILANGIVQTGAGRIRLLEVRPAGGKVMLWTAFANGRRISPPDRWLPVDEDESRTQR